MYHMYRLYQFTNSNGRREASGVRRNARKLERPLIRAVKHLWVRNALSISLCLYMYILPRGNKLRFGISICRFIDS